VVRFQEHLGPDNKPQWYFFPDQCRHCVEPPCQEAAEDDAPGGIVIDDKCGAVLYNEKLKKAKAEDIIEACPFNIPRVQKGTGLLAKCTMCVDRVTNGLLPACVKTCPTGAMNFGDREKMAALAKQRLGEAKSKYPKASVTGLDDLRAFYLLADEAKKYHKYAGVESIPKGMDRQAALRRINRSLKELSREWRILHKIAS
jgi:formate dehydrogenase iron-sulfur subunit